MVDIALLGTGGMMPMPERFLSSMMMRLNGKLILTDCGEGTQVSLKMLGWGFKAIDVICFTHYHADHISGLPGIGPVSGYRLPCDAVREVADLLFFDDAHVFDRNKTGAVRRLSCYGI